MPRITATHKGTFMVNCPACPNTIAPGRLAWMAITPRRDEIACCSELCAKRHERHLSGGR